MKEDFLIYVKAAKALRLMEQIKECEEDLAFLRGYSKRFPCQTLEGMGMLKEAIREKEQKLVELGVKKNG